MLENNNLKSISSQVAKYCRDTRQAKGSETISKESTGNNITGKSRTFNKKSFIFCMQWRKENIQKLYMEETIIK